MKPINFCLRVLLLGGLLVLTCAPSFSAAKVHPKTVRHTQIVKNARQKAAIREMQRYRAQIARRTVSGQTGSVAATRTGARISIKKGVRSPNTIYFQDDMENGTNGWTVDTQSDTLWHLTTRNSSSGMYSWWAGIENTGNYSNGSRIDQSLVSPEIDLTALQAPLSLAFTESYTTEEGKDLCMVDVTTDGGVSWTPLREGVSGNSGGWILTSLEMSSYAGKTVQIRFHFDTGDSLYNDFPGWYIDDVVILDYPGTITGKVFQDFRQDGSYDGNDIGLAGWAVSAADSSIAETTMTDADGNYTFTLPYGTYTITDVLQPGWTQTAPPSGSWTIEISSPGENFSGNDFGVWHPAVDLTGYVFADDNKNGVQDNGEVFYPGQRIYISGGTNDWIDDDFRTDPTGHFSYAVFDTGTYTLIQDFDNIDAIQTWPANGQPGIIHVANLSDIVPALPLGTYYPDRAPWIITGFVFMDDNRNGIRDSGEVPMRYQDILISGGTNYETDDDVSTDATGHFRDAVVDTGKYSISQDLDEDEAVQTFPVNGDGYDLRITLSQDTVRGIDFGTLYFSHAISSIAGKVFADINKNGIQDPGEPGIGNAQVALTDNDDDEWDYTTDTSGRYKFTDIMVGDYTVTVTLDEESWWQISPSAPYNFRIDRKTEIDTANFAEIAIGKIASISGNIFNDVNQNGVKDPGEAGIRFWPVSLTGTTVHGCHTAAYVVSDSNGNYTFRWLWPGIYIVAEELRTFWVQTYPGGFKPFTVPVGPEATVTNINFGNHQDSTVSEGYRSFTAEDLTLIYDFKGNLKWQPLKRLYPMQVSFLALFKNSGKTPKTANKLHVEFMLPMVDTLTITPWGSQAFTTSNSVDITFPAGINPDESVNLSGVCNENAPGRHDLQKIYKAAWTFADNSTSSVKPSSIQSVNSTYLPPNGADVIMAMTGHFIQVGNVAVHSILHKTYKDVGVSLLSKTTTHSGPPTCLGYYAPGKMITKQLKSLTPKYPISNNKLFAEAIALQVNILASDLDITPPGFGDLIYDEGGANPLNGKPIRAIADILNTYMSSNDCVVGRGYQTGAPQCHIPAGYEWLDSLKLWQTIRNIDSAFSGPIFVNYWVPGSVPKISLTPVRSITTVGYLRIDTSFGKAGTRQPAVKNPVQIPDRFDLMQNYPNPFNPVTTIQFNLPADAYVTIKIFNILGQEVGTLLDRQAYDAGYQSVEFDAGSFSSGVYFYRIVAEQLNDNGSAAAQTFTQVKKMMLIR